MNTSPKKNTKWIVIGSIIFVLALLIAVGPILFSKYMRAKWENTPKYKVSNLVMNVSGQIKKSNDGIYYLMGDNKQYYILENFKEDLSGKINEKCSVMGIFRLPQGEEEIDGHSVRLFLTPKEIRFADDTIRNGNSNLEDKKIEDIKEKSVKKAKFRIGVNTRLNKPILFDVVKGKIAPVNRTTLDGKDIIVFVLKDQYGDNYMLYKKNKDLSSLENKEIICLGREIIPPSNYPLVVDETTFELYEVYDTDYNKLM